jgi:threonine/homoserine/homoserine lactone efflux protein
MKYNVFISYSLVFLFGILLGFLSAIPIGAVQMQVVKKALQGLRTTAISIALGSGTSDLIYGLLTLFGLGDFLMSSRFQICFYLLGVAVLSFLLYRSIREHQHHIKGINNSLDDKNNVRRYGFLTGFTLAITNPSMVLWWIVGFKVFLDLGLFYDVTIPLKIAFVLSGVTGLAGYLILLAMIIHRIHHTISDKVFLRMNLALIIVLTALIPYFLYKAIQYAVG